MSDRLPSVYQLTAARRHQPDDLAEAFTRRDTSFVELYRTPNIASGWEDFHVHRSSESRANALKGLKSIKCHVWHGNVLGRFNISTAWKRTCKGEPGCREREQTAGGRAEFTLTSRTPSAGLRTTALSFAIEKRHGNVQGVFRVVVFAAAKTVTVTHSEQVKRETIIGTLEAAGFPAS